MLKVRQLLLILASSLLVILAGCGATSNMQELQQELVDIKTNAPRGIPPLPVFEPVRPFLYAGQSYRSPFEAPFEQVQIIQVPQVRNSGVKPPVNHVKTDLEQYSIDSLSMLGTIGMAGSNLEALIKSPDGRLHRVRSGMYIGENFGRVVNVSPKAISIVEIKPDGANSWIEAPKIINSRTNTDEDSSEANDDNV